MNAIKDNWQKLFYSVMRDAGNPDFDRDLIITPYFGNYGLAGYIISVQGSPTHGTTIYDVERDILYCIHDCTNCLIRIGGQQENKYRSKYFLASKRHLFYLETIKLLTSLGLVLSAGSDSKLEIYCVRSNGHEIQPLMKDSIVNRI